MKKIKFLPSFLLLINVFLLSSCDNVETLADGLEPDPIVGNSFFKVDFNGTTWTADATLAYVSGNTIKIEASKGSQGEAFSFLLIGNTPGTYPAKDNIVVYTPANSVDDYGYWGFNPANENENTGSVIITSIIYNATTNTISGTFAFKGYWSNADVTNVPPIDFVNGVFENIPFTTQNPTGDTFYAKVNGTEFVDTDINVAYVNNLVLIGALNSVGNNISIGFIEDLNPGTYPITGDVSADQVQGSYTLGGTTLFSATSGSVTIVSKTATKVKGTFNFVAQNGGTTHQITSGEFEVEY